MLRVKPGGVEMRGMGSGIVLCAFSFTNHYVAKVIYLVSGKLICCQWKGLAL